MFTRYSLLILSLLYTGCSPARGTATPSPHPTNIAIQTSIPSPLPTLEPTAIPNVINPLTGLVVADSSLLDLPALLVSISTFPITARPQAGLSFAPYVFEIYITEGTTRYLTTFYGELPAPEVPIVGICDVRREIFTQTDLIIGNRVWLDANKNNIQDAWERGIGGVCVNLYDEGLNLLQQTSTDSNGYYGFNVEAGKYHVAYLKPDGMEFSQRNAGDEEEDSDVDQATGWADALDISSSLLSLDAGLIQTIQPSIPSEPPPAQVGPVRSGRLVYADIASSFKDSCLIYAFASSEVLPELPKCFFVDHNIQGGGYMLDIEKMKELARESKKGEVDYAGNEFSSEPPVGGEEAARLDVYIAWLNQSAWVYDPLYQSWWRYVDNADPQAAGVLHPEVDRLTGRQLHFENVIVLFAEHDVISPTNLDIHLEQGLSGKAMLFRDGRMYSIRWDTDHGKNSPIQFRYEDGGLFPLKPGHTWITVVTPLTAVTEKKAGEWLLQFSQPPGAK
jgi:hypothetical protein